jgi:D-alanyl-D-alanine carboxypeptidase
MNKKSLYTAILFLLFSLNTHAQEVPEKLAEALQHALDSMQQQLNSRGFSAALVLPNDALWAGASGISSQSPGDSLRTDHIFAVASSSKTITGACILQLQEEGLLSIDDSLHQWLPDFNNLNGNITIRQLLHHRSGVFDILSHPTFFPIINSSVVTIWEPENALTSFLNPPDFQPGASWAYSNTNYILLGMIIEAATGNDYHEEIRNRFFEPLGMESISLMPFEAFTGEAAHLWLDLNGDGTLDDAHNFITTYNSFFSVAWSAGSFWATPSDMASWIKAYHTAGILQDESIDAAHSTVPTTMPSGTRYGLGITKRNFLGQEAFGHGGDVSYSAAVYYFPEKNIGMAVHCNDASLVSWQLDPVVRALLQTYIDCESVISSTSENQSSYSLSISPNPFMDHLNLSIESTSAQTIDLQIYDSLGKLIHQQKEVLIAGINNIPIASFKAENGLYVYKISGENLETKSGTLIKVRTD